MARESLTDLMNSVYDAYQAGSSVKRLAELAQRSESTVRRWIKAVGAERSTDNATQPASDVATSDLPETYAVDESGPIPTDAPETFVSPIDIPTAPASPIDIANESFPDPADDETRACAICGATLNEWVECSDTNGNDIVVCLSCFGKPENQGTSADDNATQPASDPADDDDSADVETGIDWDSVRASLDSEDWETDPDDSSMQRRSIYLGTVFSLYPSGKYWTGFACSNVTEDEMNRDSAFGEALESEADARGLYVFNGEGDPCDVYIGESRDNPNPDDDSDDVENLPFAPPQSDDDSNGSTLPPDVGASLDWSFVDTSVDATLPIRGGAPDDESEDSAPTATTVRAWPKVIHSHNGMDYFHQNVNTGYYNGLCVFRAPSGARMVETYGAPGGFAPEGTERVCYAGAFGETIERIENPYYVEIRKDNRSMEYKHFQTEKEAISYARAVRPKGFANYRITAFGPGGIIGKAREVNRNPIIDVEPSSDNGSRRRVYDNDMTAHVWANLSQPDGRNANDTLSFKGNVLYSYHQPIGRIVQNREGRRAVIFWGGHYSVTTSSHQSRARSAANHIGRWFFLDNVTGSAEDIIKEFSDRAEKARKECGEGRTRVSRAKRYEAYRSVVASANAFFTFFGLPTLPEPARSEEVEQTLKEEYAKNQERVKAQEEKRRREREERAKEARADLSRWIAGEDVDTWKFRSCFDTHFMRISADGSTIETTLGASVPADDVRKVAPLILRAVKSGKRFVPDSPITFGHFTLAYIDESGTVKVGCHTFDRAEIERVASLLLAD